MSESAERRQRNGFRKGSIRAYTVFNKACPGMCQPSFGEVCWADAADIYCPEKRSPSSDIPDKFYTIPPQYAFDGDVGNLDSASARSAAISGFQRGTTRLLEGILPCLVAVFEVLIQLIFSLSLMVLWVGWPFGLIIIFFQRTSA